MIKGYLDNAATTETKFFAKDFYVPGNPNSPTAIGRQARKVLEEAKQRIKNCLGVKGGKVLFCRCASEAVNKLTGFFIGDIACSKYEHESVLEAYFDCIVDYTKYPKYVQSMKEYKESDFLYLHQYVNNITGSIFDIESIGKMCKEQGAFFGSDFTSAIGHAPIPENLEDFCDAVWFSGHKFNAEQGIGAIWLSDSLAEWFDDDIDKLFKGTPNVSGAVAMSYAMEYAIDSFSRGKMYERYSELLTYLMNKLSDSGIKHFFVDSKNKNYTCVINAICFSEINADALVQFLSSRGVYISAGHSACAANQDYRVLEAFGLNKEEAEHTVRISFCVDTTFKDIDMLIEGILEFKEKFC